MTLARTGTPSASKSEKDPSSGCGKSRRANCASEEQVKSSSITYTLVVMVTTCRRGTLASPRSSRHVRQSERSTAKSPRSERT